MGPERFNNRSGKGEQCLFGFPPARMKNYASRVRRLPVLVKKAGNPMAMAVGKRNELGLSIFADEFGT